MTREDKIQLSAELSEKLASTDYFYIADSAGMTVADINAFRRMCFEKGVEYKVVKNTLIKKALDKLDADYAPFDDILKGFSGIMFSPEVGNLPAKILKDFQKKNKTEKPAFKAASIDSSLYVGEEHLGALSELKSKDEMIGEVITLLQSPARNVLGAILSGGGRVAGMIKGIAEKGE